MLSVMQWNSPTAGGDALEKRRAQRNHWATYI